MIKNSGIEIFAPYEFMPSERAAKQLEEIAKDPRIKKPVLGLVDIHDKKGNDFPTGVVAASSDYIFPQLMVSGPNCGMRMITTPLLYNNLTENDIDKLFTALSKEIYVNSFFGEQLSKDDIVDILTFGAMWIEKKYPNTEVELKNIELQGNAFSENKVNSSLIIESIPKSILDISRHRMGIMGKGNHFIELQVVEEVFEKEAADIFSIRKNGLSFLMHSGSGGLGAMISNLYSPKNFESRELKMHAFVILEWIKSIPHKKRRDYLINMHFYKKHGDNLLGLKNNSDLAGFYITSLKAAANFAYTNRAFIAMKMKKIIQQQWNLRQNELKTLYDLSHMSIARQKYNNEVLWIHRIGGVLALSAKELPNENIFKQTGTPIFLPGSMGDATYICVSTDNNAKTYYSASHGAGRISEDKIKTRAANREELITYLKENSVSLYSGYSKNIIRQDPRCFKNIDKTIAYLEEKKMVKKIAKLKPIAVLKG